MAPVPPPAFVPDYRDLRVLRRQSDLGGRPMKGFSPATVLTCGAVPVTAFLVTRRTAVGQAFCLVAYSIGLLSCWRGALLYPKGSPIRLGWLAMGGNCLLSVFRHMALIPKQFAIDPDRIDMVSQTLQLPALTSYFSVWGPCGGASIGSDSDSACAGGNALESWASPR